MNYKNSIYVIKVALLIGKKENPYRIMALNKTDSLFDFAATILSAFNFHNNHAFGFYDNTKNWLKSKYSYELFFDEGVFGVSEGAQSVKNNTIEIAFTERNKMLFLFDYGVEWLFKLELIEKADSETNIRYPLVTKSVGKAPKHST